MSFDTWMRALFGPEPIVLGSLSSWNDCHVYIGFGWKTKKSGGAYNSAIYVHMYTYICIYGLHFHWASKQVIIIPRGLTFITPEVWFCAGLELELTIADTLRCAISPYRIIYDTTLLCIKPMSPLYPLLIPTIVLKTETVLQVFKWLNHTISFSFCKQWKRQK